ncbi:MAG: EAL domain-containing protein, partial [Thermoanaerobaculia bacterium]|nr:EAL domain-containing protein [Thermoanaerobaculia bacterium]
FVAAPAPARAATNRPPYPARRVEEAIAAGELVNFYQPKVSVRTGAVTGVETLVRWRHPEDGLVSPDRFIPIAEESGLIDALTRVVLSGAIAQARAWLDRGLALKVAINVSMENLTSLDFPDFVAEAVAAGGLAAESVGLEVTESRLMKDPLAALDVLTRLRLKHVGLSIDDFGTGHSSQAQLRDIPFQELKIDRSFVHGAARNAGLRAMLEANVRMAHQLGMWTVAEGVEDLEDWNLMRELDGDLAQGYFISRPIAGADVPAWIDAWEKRRPALIR